MQFPFFVIHRSKRIVYVCITDVEINDNVRKNSRKPLNYLYIYSSRSFDYTEWKRHQKSTKNVTRSKQSQPNQSTISNTAAVSKWNAKVQCVFIECVRRGHWAKPFLFPILTRQCVFFFKLSRVGQLDASQEVVERRSKIQITILKNVLVKLISCSCQNVEEGEANYDEFGFAQDAERIGVPRIDYVTLPVDFQYDAARRSYRQSQFKAHHLRMHHVLWLKCKIEVTSFRNLQRMTIGEW